MNIKIYLKDLEDHIILCISDNGIGFEENKKTDGIGMDLIKSFTAKLPNGKYKFNCEDGVKFILEFDKKELQ